MRIEYEQPGPDQESVWSYPRPPLLVQDHSRVVVRCGDTVIADSDNVLRYIETASPPTYFVPKDDVDMERLTPSQTTATCEWRGEATIYDLACDDEDVHAVAIGFHDPAPEYAPLADYIAFHAGRIGHCEVDGEKASPQDGHYYFGWITSRVVGPFKGSPGTLNW